MLAFIPILILAFATNGYGLRRQKRMVYGEEGLRSQYPFVGYVEGCTVSILNANTVLTAAHCVCPDVPIEVVVGAESFDEKSSNKSQVVPIEKVIIHPEWISDNRKCRIGPHPRDIAIIKLTSEIQFTSFIQPVKLFCGRPYIDEDFTILGYGFDETQRDGFLKFVQGRRIKEDCPSGYYCLLGKSLNHDEIGDSGGPAVLRREGIFSQVGVTSGVYKINDLEGGPQAYIYCKVTSSCSWIKSLM